jgi:hypothetical protein
MICLLSWIYYLGNGSVIPNLTFKFYLIFITIYFTLGFIRIEWNRIVFIKYSLVFYLNGLFLPTFGHSSHSRARHFFLTVSGKRFKKIGVLLPFEFERLSWEGEWKRFKM